jgi:hypothetical protein
MLSEIPEEESVDGPVDDRPGQPRRLLAVGFGTLTAVIAYWAVIVAVAAASETGSTWFPFIVGELISPFAAALGCGGALALRVDGVQRIWHRLIGVAGITVYVFIVVRVAFGFALLVTPFLPLTTVLVADYISERRSS